METITYTGKDTDNVKLDGVLSFSPSCWGMCFLLWDSYLVTIDGDEKTPHFHVEMNCSYFNMHGDESDHDYRIDCKSKEERMKDCEYFAVLMLEGKRSPEHIAYGRQCKIYACTTKEAKVTWFDNFARFTFDGIADQDYNDEKFRNYINK